MKSTATNRVIHITLWLTGVLLLCAGALLRNPLLLSWRTEIMGMLFVFAPIGLLVFCQRCFLPARWGFTSSAERSWILATLWATAIAIGAMQQGEYLWRRQQILQGEDGRSELIRRLGSHLIVGYGSKSADMTAISRLAERGLIGGIFVGAHNVRGRSIESIREDIAALQAARSSAGLPPLIVATDQEGGIVSRLSPPLPHMPSLAKLIANAPTDDIEALAYIYGVGQGRDLARIGINVNLAPLADLSSAERKLRFDFRSLIGHRAIDDDPERVARAVSGYARGLEAAGVRATLKHFPGLGRVDADTHVFPARLNATPEALEAHDWRPFRQGLRASRALLMVGHATLEQVDDEKPASLSRRVIDGIVRQQWRHDGIIMTDDLSMGAVAHRGLCRSGISALDAGVDLLLVSYDVEQYYTVLHCLLQAARTDGIDPAMLAASRRRLARLWQTI